MKSAEQIAIRELETEIRDFISHPRQQRPLLQDKAQWNVLCSSLDILGDTELAIESYLALPEGDDVGTRYLLVYGILQVLFVQQDAIEALVKSFGLPYQPDATLVEIREIRNKTTGHPTKRGNARASKHRPQTSHFLARYSIRKSGYKLMTSFPDRQSQFDDVDILDLIIKQRAEVKKVLEQVWSALKAEEMEHRDKFKGERLTDHFPPTTDYMISKVAEACDSDSASALPMGDAALSTIQEHIVAFKQALENRGILNDLSDLKYEFAEIEYPLEELDRFLRCQSVLDRRGAAIFAFFVRHKLQDLERAAKELDEEYNSDEV